MEFKLISSGKDAVREYFAICEITYGNAMHLSRSLFGYEITCGRIYIDIFFLRIG